MFNIAEERTKILRSAEHIVNCERQKTYGDAEDNFTAIAEFWETYLGHQVKINADDVANMMSLLKIARISTGGGTVDSYVDLAGYAACGGAIYEALNIRKCKEEGE